MGLSREFFQGHVGLLQGLALGAKGRIAQTRTHVGAFKPARGSRSGTCETIAATAWLGAHAQAAYGIANSYLDGLARRLSAQGRRAVSVALGPVAGVGMAAGLEARMADRGIRPLPLNAAMVAVARAVPAGIRVPPVSLVTLGEVLTTPRLVVAVSLTAFFLGGSLRFHSSGLAWSRLSGAVSSLGFVDPYFFDRIT
jgi:hypothetical protein